jgi:hypothetical protein
MAFILILDFETIHLPMRAISIQDKEGLVAGPSLAISPASRHSPATNKAASRNLDAGGTSAVARHGQNYPNCEELTLTAVIL